MMHLGFHGGKCCAIKHIFNMGSGPHDVQPELVESPYLLNDLNGEDVSSSMRYYYHAAPMESSKERLNRYVSFLRQENSGSIVEIVLADSEYEKQTKAWHEILNDLGFKIVSEVMNSNSDNMCYVYHLVIDDYEPVD